MSEKVIVYEEIAIPSWLMDLIGEYRWLHFPEVVIKWVGNEIPEEICNTEQILSRDKKLVTAWFAIDTELNRYKLGGINDIREEDVFMVKVESIYTIPDPKWENRGYLSGLTIKIWTNLKEEVEA